AADTAGPHGAHASARSARRRAKRARGEWGPIGLCPMGRGERSPRARIWGPVGLCPMGRGERSPPLIGIARRVIRVHALTPFVLAPLVERAGAPPYRITQVLDWVYRRGATDPAAMTTLPRELRAVLANDLAGPSLETAAISRSSDGTRKLALRCADGEL